MAAPALRWGQDEIAKVADCSRASGLSKAEVKAVCWGVAVGLQFAALISLI